MTSTKKGSGIPGETEARLRAIWARFKDTGDLGLAESFDPEIEWHLRADLPEPRTLRGHEQVAQLYAEWTETFEDLQLEPLDISEVGDRTIAVVHFRGRIKGSRQEVDMDEVWVYGWRDEKVIEIREYRTKDEALQSLGNSVRRAAGDGDA
ncbi:MAG TPA: nuclear transport factor 2 family protein [Solirubrobacteraceae bacterium]|nr:nuclear transport factor 2 family protein [Solirubrobacteraceae bacterium]